MGFYGNITNTSRTQFQFDRIYSSRTEMDAQKYQDGIYAGRYVLVEYDEAANLQLDTFLRVIFTAQGAYNQADDAKALLKVGDMKKRENPYVYTADINKDPSLGITPKNCVFYKWINVEDSDDTPAKFIHVIESENNYTINYKLDTDKYGEGRGYDSTVWQKMYIDNVEKYVMIAELNTVVPTFDVTPDAPTINPIVPHFDTGSTDVYYKLHYQPQWGFRLKGSESNITIENEESAVKIVSNDEASYPSDHTVKYAWSDYNPKTGVETNTEIEYPAAIYYNKAGLDPAVRTRYEGYSDEISILPTGLSGNKYNNHDGTNSVSEQVDTQELKILLPAIGNMVSDAWDMVYGYNEEDNKRYRDIEWKLVEDTENFEIGGMTRDVHTFAGCINTIHDLIGMIVTKEKPEPTKDEYDKKYIYMTESDDGVIYERILRQPTYASVDVGEFISEYETFLNTTYPSTQEKNTAYENLFRNFQEENYYIKNEKNEYLFINIKALPDYIVVKNDGGAQWNGTELFTDGEADYQYIQIQGLEDHLLTILGSLIDCRNLLGTDTPATTDRSTVQGALNALNGIIDRFKSAVPGQFTFVDENGKLISMNWTTKQPFSWINYGNKNQSSEDDIENRYIDLTFNFDEGLINLTHKYNPIENTTTVADKNSENGTGNNAGKGDTVNLYTPIVDNMGHVVGHNVETVTLPYGYKIIKVSNTESTIAPNNSIIEDGQIADNTQDTINFNASNRWIKLDNVSEDIIKFGHRLGEFAEGTEANILYGLTQDESHTGNLNEDNEFEVPCLSFDEAGHITEARTHKVTLPENFDTIEVEISSKNFQNENKIEGTAGTIKPDTMTDTLKFVQGNKWLLIDADEENDRLIFSHYVDDFSESLSATDFNAIDVNKTFSIQELEWDTAGHIIKSNKHTYTMPDNFKNINISNSGANETVVDASTSNGTIIADTLTDALSIDTGNRWIQLVTDVNNDKFTICHAPAGAASETTFDSAETPDYGMEFTIPEVKYDQAGHIKSVDTHTVKFPVPELNDLEATGSSVLTGLSMTDGKLAITQTHADVGTLKLKGYTQADETDKISADDTINGAINKLAQRIKNHEDELNTLVGEGKLKESFDTLVEMSEWLDANDTELRQTLVDADNALNKKIDDEIIARETKDKAIDAAAAELSGKVDLEISERKNNDSTHATGIKNNADAIKAIELVLEDTFNPETLFDWGYKRVETPGTETEIIDGDPVLDAEGNPTYDEEGNQIFEKVEQIKNFVTISYEPYQATIQNILNEILAYHKDLRAIGSDNGDKIYTD